VRIGAVHAAGGSIHRLLELVEGGAVSEDRSQAVNLEVEFTLAFGHVHRQRRGDIVEASVVRRLIGLANVEHVHVADVAIADLLAFAVEHEAIGVGFAAPKFDREIRERLRVDFHGEGDGAARPRCRAAGKQPPRWEIQRPTGDLALLGR
jgi:hypothetical protein